MLYQTLIESSKVTSGGKIISDAIMHSDVIAQDAIEVHGKRGLIAGGKDKVCNKN